MAHGAALKTALILQHSINSMHSASKSTRGGNSRPLPLKQRTSSVDQRRDFNTQTWTSLLTLLKAREYIITVDHFSLWRRHLAWAMENGEDLRNYMTARYASSMVFMSLLLSAELNVLFNSAVVTTNVRHALRGESHSTVAFWTGIMIIVSAVLTLLSLISSFTAWTMVSSVSEANAHCIFRSSIGQYVAELPGRFIVASIYSFMTWLILFFFLLLPAGFYSITLMTLSLALFVHTITAFSAFGRFIMHTGAMGSQKIFDPAFEMTLHPHSLHQCLLTKAKAQLSNSTSIIRQYRHVHQPLDRHYSEDELCSRLMTPEAAPVRKRANSLVKFADGFDINGDRLPVQQSARQAVAGHQQYPAGRHQPHVGMPPSPRSALRNKSSVMPPRYTTPATASDSASTRQLDTGQAPPQRPPSIPPSIHRRTASTSSHSLPDNPASPPPPMSSWSGTRPRNEPTTAAAAAVNAPSQHVVSKISAANGNNDGYIDQWLSSSFNNLPDDPKYIDDDAFRGNDADMLSRELSLSRGYSTDSASFEDEEEGGDATMQSPLRLERDTSDERRFQEEYGALFEPETEENGDEHDSGEQERLLTSSHRLERGDYSSLKHR